MVCCWHFLGQAGDVQQQWQLFSSLCLVKLLQAHCRNSGRDGWPVLCLISHVVRISRPSVGR